MSDSTPIRPLSVGVIGCGSLAQAVHLPHIARLPRTRLAWVCDVDSSTRDKAFHQFHPDRVTDDYLDLMRDPEVDAVVLATDQTFRLPAIRAAAETGKALYCEKPVAASLEEAETILRLVEASGMLFCVGHNRRSAPSIQYLRRLFLRQRQSPHPCPWRFDRNSSIRPRWPEEDQAFMVIRINDDVLSWKAWAVQDDIMATGPMLFEMTHFTDLACWFMGLRPVQVTATGHTRMNHVVTVEFEEGSLASILQTGVGTFGYPKELYEVYCQGAAMVLDHFVEVRTAGMESIPARVTFPLQEDRAPEASDGGGIRDYYAKRRAAELKTMATGDPGRFFEFEPVVDKGHRSHLARFLDAVRGKGPNPFPCAESLTATRVAFAAVDSLRHQRSIAL